MRNLLALIGLAVVGFGGAGWYLGWYTLSVTRSGDGNLQIKADVDTKKAGTDVSDGLHKVSNAVETRAKQAAQDANANLPTGTPGATPGPVSPPSTAPFNPFSSHPAELPKLPDVNISVTPPSGTIRLVPPK